MRFGPLGAGGGSAVTRCADVAIQPVAPPIAAATPPVAPILSMVRRDIPIRSACPRRDCSFMAPPDHGSCPLARDHVGGDRDPVACIGPGAGPRSPVRHKKGLKET